ncbi:MAG: Rdx family protein [Planctomycetes bacterium]|nr:Rdx family protein [Planctomycetota bacterium]
MKAKFGESSVEPELIEGSKGIFDVEVDGTLLFSKGQAGRFPQYQEVPTAITMAGLAE